MAKKAQTTKNLPAVKEDTSTALIATTSIKAAMLGQLQIDRSQFSDYETSIDKELFRNDIIIPKIWLVQQMSEAFKNGEAQLGSFISSQSKEELSSGQEDLLFIPLSIFKRWQEFKLDSKGKKEFIRSEIITKDNINLPYEDTLEGESIVRRQVISAYVVLVEDVKKGLNIPYVIDFASTSKGAGRSLITDVATIETEKLPMYFGYFRMNSKEETKDKNDYFIKEVSFAGAINANDPRLVDHLKNCYNHIKVSKEMLVPDDSDIVRDQTIDDLEDRARNKNSRASKASAEI